MRTYGLIGKSLAHSFSKKYFTEKFESEKIASKYELFELKNIDEFLKLTSEKLNLRGLNVTIPYKSEVLQFVDEQNEIVQEIGATNALKIHSNGKISAHNSDVFGFYEMLREQSLHKIHGDVLILGTGGAAKAVEFVFRNWMQADNIFLASRNPNGYNQLNYSDLRINEFTFIINTTPLGTFPSIHEKPPINYSQIHKKQIAIDLVYNPMETLFLQKAKQRSAKTLNGWRMLVLQAEKSWMIWNERD